MPDNVETGFKSAATIVRKVGDNKSLAERNKEKRFLINLWIRTVIAKWIRKMKMLYKKWTNPKSRTERSHYH